MVGTASGKPQLLRKRPLSIALLVVLSGSASALDVTYEMGVAAKHSDNINLSDDNPISDTVISPRLYFQAEQIGPTLQATAEGNLEYLHYSSGTFDEETRGGFAGQLNWTVLPQRLDFVVQDYLSLEPVDELVPFAPNNQQQVNVFIAGPTLHARLGSSTRAQVDLRYINSYAEEDEEFDSDRFSAAGRIVRDLDANHSVSANVEATDVKFDLAGGASDYRRYDGYFNSTTTRQHVDLSLDLGYSRLELDSSGSDSYPLARATLDWRVSPRSRLTTTVRYQLSDATQGLISPLDLDYDRRRFNDFRIPRGLVQPDALRERVIRTRYRYSSERLDLEVAPYYRRFRYIESTLEDQDRRGANLNIDYRLRPRLTLAVYAAAQRRDYVEISRDDEYLLAGVGLANRFTRNWTGRVDFQRRERDSTQPGQDYEENSVLVSFSYQR